MTEKLNLEIKSQKTETILKKEELWSDKLRELAELKMDDGIIEIVAALNLNDIPTCSSCFGHTEGRYNRIGLPYIAIKHFYDSKIAGLKKSDIDNNPELKAEWEKGKEKIQIQDEKIKELVEEFNFGRQNEYNLKLKFNEGVIKVTTKKLENFWEKFKDTDPCLDLTKQEASEHSSIIMPLLSKAQEEMRAFGEFLKNKFFEIE